MVLPPHVEEDGLDVASCLRTRRSPPACRPRPGAWHPPETFPDALARRPRRTVPPSLRAWAAACPGCPDPRGHRLASAFGPRINVGRMRRAARHPGLREAAVRLRPLRDQMRLPLEAIGLEPAFHIRPDHLARLRAAGVAATGAIARATRSRSV